VPDYYGLTPVVFSGISGTRQRNTAGDCGNPCDTGCNQCAAGTWRHTIQVKFDNIGPGDDCDDCEPPWTVDLEAYPAIGDPAPCKWSGHKPDPCGEPNLNYQIECTISSITGGFRITVTADNGIGRATFVRDIIAETLDCTDLAGTLSLTDAGDDTNCDWSAATCEILDSFD
jgi:hypothetical protein